MTPQLIEFFAGQRHQFGALVLYRGDTFIETIEEGGMGVFIFFRGTATITRNRQGEQVGLHITPLPYQPVVLRHQGTYCVVAKNHTVGCRLLRTGAT